MIGIWIAMFEPYFSKSDEIWNWLPRLQAHRGHWIADHLQNTLFALQQAVQSGYAMAEFDVRVTLDGHVILFHDAELNGIKINKMTLAEIKNRILVSTLEEVFLWIKTENINLKLNIEIKSESVFSYQTEKLIFGLIKKYQLATQVLISSFNPFSLFKIRLYDSNIFRAILVTYENHPKNKCYLKKMLFNFLAAPHVLNVFYQSWSSMQKQKNQWTVPVVLWTVNDVLVAKRYLNTEKSEVWGVISDTILPESL